jgi:hypothetical protein
MINNIIFLDISITLLFSSMNADRSFKFQVPLKSDISVVRAHYIALFRKLLKRVDHVAEKDIQYLLCL